MDDNHEALPPKATGLPFDETTDRYKCIVLDLRKMKHYCENKEFEPRLIASLQLWVSQDVRALSVFVPKQLSERIPTLVKHEFEFHHAKPGYVLLLKWLSKTDTNNFPDYANHYLGVAGFVVNDKNQVLAIKERYTTIEARWKLPGGGADAGEELGETARREVLEETGINSEFQGVLCFRQQHDFRYGCSDFYFVCLMKALNHDINACVQEIAQCQWMDIEEYGRQNLYPSNQYIYKSYLHSMKTGTFIKPTEVLNYTNTGMQLFYRAESI